MKNAEWNNLRAKLNHDWLQNRYLTFLTSWRDCFNGAESCEIDKIEILEQLLTWKAKKKDFNKLIDNIEEALSPKQLLYEHPLNIMAEESKKWLGEVIHATYCSTTGIKNKIADLQLLIEEADKSVDLTALILKGEIKAEKSQRNNIINLFTEFSKKISELPHEIQLG